MTVKNPRRVDKQRTQKRARSELSGLKWAEVLDALHARLPVKGSHTLANAETYHDAWHESRRTATAEEVKPRRCCGSRHTTTGPEFKFSGPRLETIETCHRDQRREPSRSDGERHFSQNTCNLTSVGS